MSPVTRHTPGLQPRAAQAGAAYGAPLAGDPPGAEDDWDYDGWAQAARARGVDLAALPAHVAIIMDGNGRWAKAKGMPRQAGHRQGVEAVRRTVRAAYGLRLPCLTVYSFSSENWKRPAEEVSGLMNLLKMYIRSDLKELAARNIRIRIIGAREGLAGDILSLIEDAESRTRGNTGLNLVIAFNYGGQDEIVRAARRLAEEAAAGTLAPEAISPQAIAERLDTAGLPDPDMLLRTSGEQRVSNFLTWQCAYAEFVFMDVLWPDFSGRYLIDSIRLFQTRERRFGGRPEAAPCAEHSGGGHGGH